MAKGWGKVGCSIEGCDGAHKSKGFCDKHYRRWLAYGDPFGGRTPYGTYAVCTIEGCNEKFRAGKWCLKHYERFRAHGDPLFTKMFMQSDAPGGMKACPGLLCKGKLHSLDEFKSSTGTARSRCRECEAQRAADEREFLRQNDPGKLKERNLRGTLRKYNLTPAKYDARLSEQGGVCAVCKTADPGVNERFHVDHDHLCCPEPGKSCGKCIRGLLCSHCNLNLWDDPEKLRAKADYIEKFRANHPELLVHPFRRTI